MPTMYETEIGVVNSTPNIPAPFLSAGRIWHTKPATVIASKLISWQTSE